MKEPSGSWRPPASGPTQGNSPGEPTALDSLASHLERTAHSVLSPLGLGAAFIFWLLLSLGLAFAFILQT